MSTPSLSASSITTSVLVGTGEEGAMSANKGFSTDGPNGGEPGEEDGTHEVSTVLLENPPVVMAMTV